MSSDNGSATPPLVLAGPLLRRVESHRIVLWLAVSAPVQVRITLYPGKQTPLTLQPEPGSAAFRRVQAGQRLYYLLLDLRLHKALPTGCWTGYQLELAAEKTPKRWLDCSHWAPQLCYPGRSMPGFVFAPQVASLLHGSCRRPHQAGPDGMRRVDRLLEQLIAADAMHAEPEADDDGLPAWPSALVMSGDQIYADDVAGPMLRAIHALVARLGLPDEPIQGAEATGVSCARQLYTHEHGYYHRERLLPQHRRNRKLIETLFGGVEKPVFTSASAHNHLISLGEVLAMYLLAWSPAAWEGLSLDPPPMLRHDDVELYRREQALIEAFRADLGAVQRAMAHVPVAMIFDDHDITDDWNLSREWEGVAYEHPFSRRVIGNALLAYLINQAWGNHPDLFDEVCIEKVQQALSQPGTPVHEDCLAELLAFERWHYTWPTSPPLMVLDTRTRRWRSEVAASRPSGLMDWEALTDLQHELRDMSAVLLVSPAPVFGVKLIEAVQRIFTWLGYPLMVDAENWMAHRGAAHCMLNMFAHRKTPGHFVVLSGDVHYSFVYDVHLRGHEHGPDIWQITSSGIRNEFPPRLLALFDRLNRWLYAPRSPLNWFTRRRRMRVTPRKHENAAHGRRLLNGSGIGLVELDSQGRPWRIRELLADGRTLAFSREEGAARWD